jgi:hypothetical protein
MPLICDQCGEHVADCDCPACDACGESGLPLRAGLCGECWRQVGTLTPEAIAYTADRIRERSRVWGHLADAVAGMKRMGVDEREVAAWEQIGAELVRRIEVER